ncbi:TIGR02285 family protein [Colwelliaceae bacterium 6471]
MRTTRYIFKLFVAAIFISRTCIAHSATDGRDTINWYKPDSPPGHIISGELAGQGYSDQMQNFLSKQLPEYKHKNVVASYERAVIEMQKNTGCIAGIFPNEYRREHLTYSVIRQLVFANGLIIPDRHYAKIAILLDQDGTISLETLLSQKELAFTGGVSKGRIYGTSIDNVIAKNEFKIVERASDDVFSGLLNMLAYNRVDYIFGYPVELQYALKRTNNSNKFHFIPLREMPEYLPSYVACSGSDAGKVIIEKINNVLIANRHTERFYNMYGQWLDAPSIKRLKKFSNKVFSENPIQ